MSIFKGILRTLTSPVEIAVRTASEVFSTENDNEVTMALDVCSLGVTRVARGAFNATSKTAKRVTREFDE